MQHMRIVSRLQKENLSYISPRNHGNRNLHVPFKNSSEIKHFLSTHSDSNVNLTQTHISFDTRVLSSKHMHTYNTSRVFFPSGSSAESKSVAY